MYHNIQVSVAEPDLVNLALAGLRVKVEEYMTDGWVFCY